VRIEDLRRIAPLAELMAEAALGDLRRARRAQLALAAKIASLDADLMRAGEEFFGPEEGAVLARWMHWGDAERRRLGILLAAATADFDSRRALAARAVGRTHALASLSTRLRRKKNAERMPDGAGREAW